MTMGSSMLLFFVSPILIHLVKITTAQTNFLSYNCLGSGNYSSNSTYHANLNRLLSSLTNAETGHLFYKSSFGQNPDKVYTIAICRGDLTLDVCRSCVNDSLLMLPQVCPNQKEAIVWYEGCMLRYSNRSIFYAMEVYPHFILDNSNILPDADQFNKVLSDFLSKLRNQAAFGGSPLKFASEQVNVTVFQTIYALAQCIPDLSPQQCSDCLDVAGNSISKCCENSTGFRFLGPSCYLRFEVYPFYEISTADAPPLASPPPTTTTPVGNGGKSNRSPALIIMGIFTSVILMVGIWICICIFLRVMKARKNVQTGGGIRSLESLQFDFGIIKVATNNFSDANKLGQGRFGAVYKGKFSNGEDIAVKRLSMGTQQGEQEFKNEVLLVANLFQHRNLVRLLGFCLEGDETLLIYEFVPNKSLDHFIFDPINHAHLDWERHYKIIGGIAQGLRYLHEDSQLQIIHCNLKASNILMDAEMNPKISDFGMGRLFGVDQTQGNMSRIVGTYGYMAPEYASHGHFSIKSDVYSFGVLVLEIVSGQKNSCLRYGENVEDLISYAWKNWMEGTPSNLINPRLSPGSTTEIMRCIHIGLLCVQEYAVDRPTMASVVHMLNNYSLTLPVPSRPAFLMYSSMEPDRNAVVAEA